MTNCYMSLRSKYEVLKLKRSPPSSSTPCRAAQCLVSIFFIFSRAFSFACYKLVEHAEKSTKPNKRLKRTINERAKTILLCMAAAAAVTTTLTADVILNGKKVYKNTLYSKYLIIRVQVTTFPPTHNRSHFKSNGFDFVWLLLHYTAFSCICVYWPPGSPVCCSARM